MIILEFSNTVINNPYKCKGIAKALSAQPGDIVTRLSNPRLVYSLVHVINFNLIVLFA